jgi:hypothetical protein
MRRMIAVAVLLKVMAVAAFAQGVAAPSQEEVRSLLELMGAKQSMQLMLDGMKQQMKAGAQQGFKSKLPNPTSAQLQLMDGMIDDVFSEISIDELIAVIVPVYQRHLSKSDIQAIVSFYKTPVGQKLLREQPAMMQESMQAGADLMQTRMESLMKKIDARMEQLLRSSQPRSSEPASPTK